MIEDNLEYRKIKWREIEPLQPDGYKVNVSYDAIKESIEKHGFSRPFHVWESEGKYYSIDGVQRKSVLIDMGNNVPVELSAIIHTAETRKQAIEILVDVFNQKESKVDEAIHMEWMEEEGAETLGKIDFSFDMVEEIEEPDFDDLTDEMKNKPPTMKITFEAPEQLQKAEIDIQELLDRKYGGAYFSVSCGEL